MFNFYYSIDKVRMSVILTVLWLVCLASCATRLQASEKSRPYKDMPHVLPGKIEAENYDEGEAEVAYHDNDKENQGTPYRDATQVDIESRTDASNGFGVGWTRTGEWLNYTVEAKEAGKYRLRVPVASNKKGGVFHLEVNGKDVSGPIDVPDTGSWQKLQVIEKNGIELPPGRFVLRVVMDKQGPSGSIADIDYFEFTTSSAQ